MAEQSRSDQEEFFARAITGYYGAANDELDMKEGGIYTIIQTTENGWWYAVDFEHQIDGWVPSNYLERVSTQQQNELRAQQKEKDEVEAKKHAKLAAAGAYDFAPDTELELFDDPDHEHDEEKVRSSKAVIFELTKRANEFRERQNLQAAASKGDISAQNKFENLEKERKARQLQKAVNNPFKGRKNKINKLMMLEDFDYDSDTSSDNNIMSPKELTQSKVSQYQKRRKQSRKPTMLDALSKEDIQYLTSHRPDFETLQENQTVKVGSYQSKAIDLWTVDQSLHYLTVKAKTNNTLELKNVIHHLCKKAETQYIRNDILSRNGLNIIFNILKYSENNIAISTSCCKALQIFCESDKCAKFPAEKVGVFYLSTVVRTFYKEAVFAYTAFNCVGNFVYHNDVHRDYILKDKYNKVLIGYIIEGMNKFRYSDDNIKSSSCDKVLISACLALENLAVTDEGREVIGTDGIEAVLDTFIAHMDNDSIIDATLRTLINLCINENNADHFISNGGLDYLSTYLRNHLGQSDDRSMQIKTTICRILRNISTEQSTANTLYEQEELIDVITSLAKDSDFSSELFYETLQFVNALITTLHEAGDKKKTNHFLLKLEKKGLFNVLMAALEPNSYQHDAPQNKYRKDINAQIAAVMNCYFLSKDDDIRQMIFNEETLTEAASFFPSKLIQVASETPSSALLYYTMSIFFECVMIDDYGALVKKALLSVGILDFLLMNESWYESKEVEDDVIAVGVAIVLSYLQIWMMDRHQNGKDDLQCDWDLNEYRKAIERFNRFIVNKKIRYTKSEKLKQAQENLGKIVKLIPDLLKLYE